MEKKYPQDQIYKYPTGRNGKEWQMAEGFKSESFEEDLVKLKMDFQRIKEILTNSTSIVRNA